MTHDEGMSHKAGERCQDGGAALQPRVETGNSGAEGVWNDYLVAVHKVVKKTF